MSSICRVVRNSANEPVSYSLDPTKVTVTEGRKLSKGKFSNVRYNGGGALYLETPYLHAPTSVSSFEDEGKKSIFVSCRGHEEKDDIRVFVEALTGLQDRIIDQVSDLKLIGEKFKRDTVAGVMSPFLKVSEQYPPSFRVSLPMRDGKQDFDMYCKDGKKVESTTLENTDVRGAVVKIIFTISSVWVVNKTWGISAKVKQLLVKPAMDVPTSGLSCFTDLALDEEDDETRPIADLAQSDGE